MTKKEITRFLHSIIHEVILYPSYGTLPYTFIVYTDEEVMPKYGFQENVSHYVGIHFWDNFNREDLVDFLTNSPEAQGLDFNHRQLLVQEKLVKYQEPEAYRFWLSKQVALAIGMLIGYIDGKLKLRIANPEEIEYIESEGLLVKNNGLSLVSILLIESS